MLYERHRARPPLEVFESIKKTTPNYSCRMDNLRAAILRPQLKNAEIWQDVIGSDHCPVVIDIK